MNAQSGWCNTEETDLVIWYHHGICRIGVVHSTVVLPKHSAILLVCISCK